MAFNTDEVCNILVRIKLKRETKERLRVLREQKANIELQIEATQQELTDLQSTKTEEDAYDAIKQALDILEG